MKQLLKECVGTELSLSFYFEVPGSQKKHFRSQDNGFRNVLTKIYSGTFETNKNESFNFHN